MTAHQDTECHSIIDFFEDVLAQGIEEVAQGFRQENAVRDQNDDDDWDNPRAGEDLPPVPAKVSVQRCATDLLMEVDLPGVQPNNVSVRVTEEGIHVRGLRRPLDEYPDRKTMHDSVQRGPYEALLRLPTKVSRDDLNAVLADGVLEVYIQDVFEAKQEEFDVPVEYI